MQLKYPPVKSSRLHALESSERLLVQQWPLILLHPLRYFPLLPVDNPILVVHHLDYKRLIRRVDGCDRNVPHSTELTAVIQVFVLQTEEVPDKAAEDLQWSSDRRH